MSQETILLPPSADPKDLLIEAPGLGLVDPSTGEVVVPPSNPGGRPIPASRGQLHGKIYEREAILAFGVPADWKAHPHAPMDLPAELSPTGVPMSFKTKVGTPDKLAALDSGDAGRALLWDSHTLSIAFCEQVSPLHKAIRSVLEIDMDMGARLPGGALAVWGQYARHAKEIGQAKALIASAKGRPPAEAAAIAAKAMAILDSLGEPEGAMILRPHIGSKDCRLQCAIDPRKLLAAGFSSRTYSDSYRGMGLSFFIRSASRVTRLTRPKA